MIRPDGQGVETPMMAAKPRGNRLDDAQARLIHDLLCHLCLDVLRLSVPETVKVMNRPIGERHLRDRQSQIGPEVAEVGVFPYLAAAARSVQRAG